MKFQARAAGEVAQLFEVSAIGGGVEFRRDDDHRLFRQRGAERRQFVLDDFEIVDRDRDR